jgi:hypothetical protein
LTIDYMGAIDSYFNRNGTIYSLNGTTTNGTVQQFSTRSPYAGGSAINKPEEMSLNALRIATIFTKTYSGTFPNCWASGYIEGTLQIEETPQYPAGTPLELQIDYLTEMLNNYSSGYYIDRGVAILNQSYDTLWEGTHYTQENIESYYIPIMTGSTYLFYVWQTFGTEYVPVNRNNVGVAISVDFHVIPEPTSLAFLLGGLLLSRRKH